MGAGGGGATGFCGSPTRPRDGPRRAPKPALVSHVGSETL